MTTIQTHPTTLDVILQQGQSVESLIGETPLVRLRNTGLTSRSNVQLLLKPEWGNPGGSVKDRIAYQIILDAKKSGALTKETRLLDATSGNTGIGYAMVGAMLGYRVTLVMPSSVSKERIQILNAYGAELYLTDEQEGLDGAIRFAQDLADKHPHKYYYADQYGNDSNWKAHFRTTGPEIWRQTNGSVTHFVAGLGTSGTMMGVGRYLLQMKRSVQLVAIQPDAPTHGIKGLKHMESSMVPGIYDETLIDDHISVTTDEAYRVVKDLARYEGLFVGISSGAAVAGALRLARSLDDGVVVTMLPDAGYKYLSTGLWE
ncbi:MAG: cysteine synthase [Chloroflexota bacterium]